MRTQQSMKVFLFVVFGDLSVAPKWTKIDDDCGIRLHGERILVSNNPLSLEGEPTWNVIAKEN